MMMMSVMNESEATRDLGLLLRDCNPYLPPLERLRDFFAAGADPNIIIGRLHGDNFPQTILHFVRHETYREDDGIANALAVFEQFVLNPMFDIDALNSSGRALIHTACELSNPDFLRVILRSGRVNVNLPSPGSIFDGYTALHFACDSGKVEQAKLLLEDGRVDINARDSRGRTPLFAPIVFYYGSERENYDIVAMLISRGCDVMATDIFDCNVLHYCKDPNICRLLLDNGADPLHVDEDGHTPIQDAHAEGLYEVRDLMVKHVNFPRFRAIYQLMKEKQIPMNTLKAIHSQSHPALY
jgi:ankyrin repeat protein